MRFGLATAMFCLVLLLFFHSAEAREFKVLDAYGAYADSPSVNSPADYITWLKTQPRFKDGQLDRLPDRAVILHHVDVRRMLNRLGYPDEEIEELRIGHNRSEPAVRRAAEVRTGLHRQSRPAGRRRHHHAGGRARRSRRQAGHPYRHRWASWARDFPMLL